MTVGILSVDSFLITGLSYVSLCFVLAVLCCVFSFVAVARNYFIDSLCYIAWSTILMFKMTLCVVLKCEQAVTSSSSLNGISSSSNTGLSLDSTHRLKTKKKIIIGNISKYFASVSLLLYSTQIYSVEIIRAIKKK